MFQIRFPGKTKEQSITTIFLVVVMLILFISSCSKENREVIDVVFDPEEAFLMKTTDASMLISDSGVTRYRMVTKEYRIYTKSDDPYWYFPDGIYVEKFDTLFHIETSIKADTAYYYNKRDFVKLIGNVTIRSLQGELFETSLLYWDGATGKCYSDQYIRIEQADKVITGIGFESNQDMSQYKIFNSQGIFPVNETPADSTKVEDKSIPQ